MSTLTDTLIDSFADALREKLAEAELKYGYNDDWLRPNWQAVCHQHMLEHIDKGDPRDVAIYCAFKWFHAWPSNA